MARTHELTTGPAGFIVVLVTFWVWYRARRGGKTSGGCLAFCMPKRKSDSYYRQLQSPHHGWESRGTEYSERKPSMQSRSGSISPIMTSPTPRTRAVMSPAPARLNSTFIGRERNNLVRASLNRHQLSTLDEHSSYEYESEPVVYYTPPPPRRGSSGTSSPTTPRSLAQQISSSAHQPKPPTPIASLSDNGPRGPPVQLDSNYSVAPLQLRKADLARQSTRSSWTTITQPVTPGAPPPEYPFPPPDDTVPRFRSVDHWADYQNRMAQQGRSMTSGEYSQAFRDRDSTADSMMGGKRESSGTIAVFRYHPGEEVSMGGGAAPVREVEIQPPYTIASAAASPISPHTTFNNSPLNFEPYRPTYQPFQPARRMHSARNPRAGPRYQSNTAPTSSTNTGAADRPPSSDSSSSPSSSAPPSPPDAPQPIYDGSNYNGSYTTPTNHHRQESEATVFNYHPGQEVMIDRADKIKSEDLDAYFGPPQRSTSHRS